MAKTNFVEQLEQVRKVVTEAILLIETAPLKKGQIIQLLKKGGDVNEMPMISRVDKHNCYDEFGVVAISKPEKSLFPTEVILHLEGRGEVSDEKKEIPVSELNDYYMLDDLNTCILADMISEELKK